MDQIADGLYEFSQIILLSIIMTLYGCESLKTPMIKINEMPDNDNIMVPSPHGCEALTFVDIIKTAGVWFLNVMWHTAAAICHCLY